MGEGRKVEGTDGRGPAERRDFKKGEVLSLRVVVRVGGGVLQSVGGTEDKSAPAEVFPRRFFQLLRGFGLAQMVFRFCLAHWVGTGDFWEQHP